MTADRTVVEARIGELLGEATMGRPSGKSERDQTFDDHQRRDFRLLARAYDGGAT